VAHTVVGGISGSPGRIGKMRAVRFSAWIWVFSWMDTATAFSGGFRYNPTMSRTLASSSARAAGYSPAGGRHGSVGHAQLGGQQSG